MKIRHGLILTAAAVAAFFLAGCSTPQTRIAANPGAFAQLSPDQQALVRQGRVGVGMTMQAVQIALGAPDRVTVRTDASGQTVTWHYVEYAYVDGPYLYPGWAWGGAWGGGWGRRGRWGGGWGWGPYWNQPMMAYDRFKVEYHNGLVVSFSQDQP